MMPPPPKSLAKNITVYMLWDAGYSGDKSFSFQDTAYEISSGVLIVETTTGFEIIPLTSIGRIVIDK